MGVRTEQEIFDDLAALCASPGYAHAIAYICFRDHIVGYGDVLKSEDYTKLFSDERLIRTEVSTLIGLMVRAPRDLALPDMQTLESYISDTETLLSELHDAFNEPAMAGLSKPMENPSEAEKFNPFASAESLREPIFYGAESAYTFQYQALSLKKYANDRDWFETCKGFAPEEAEKVVSALGQYLSEKLSHSIRGLKDLPQEKQSVLPGFQFTVNDIAEKSALPKSTVEAVVDAFTCPEDGNPTFSSLNEFNATNAFPILKADGDNRILLLYASLAEALYETPFYWMNNDAAYRATAMINRGAFTENFTTSRLQRVFGTDKVFQNVDIWETSSRKKKLGEIDTLVLFGDRAIVVQAKSKKLTLAARKGNDFQLQADFKAAVQDACDQAVACSEHLLAGTSVFALDSGEELLPPKVLKKIHPVCAVSDHYPALSFQAQQFLSFGPTEKIAQPLVCDVFFVDVVTEFLETPLRFLSYLELRAKAADKVSLSHEIVALGYHLHQNLWLGEVDFIMLGDDLSVDVDIAMAARREGVKGQKNPPGILTELKGTSVGRIIDEIELRSEPGAIGTGLELLKLSSKSAMDLSRFIDKIAIDVAKDGIPRDITVPFGQSEGGITVHCNELPEDVAGPKLRGHADLRKYSTKSSIWCGLVIRPGDGSVRFGLTLDYPWKREKAMELAVSKMSGPKTIREATREIMRGAKQRKVGRNDLCPCGSGLKYKKCHLLKGGPF